MAGKLFIKPSDLEISYSSIVGQKAKNLSTLPPCWVPEYFVISSTLFDRWRENINVNVKELLDKKEYSELTHLLKNLICSEESQIIVRSSSDDEGLKQRGAYLSKEIFQPDSSKIIDGINAIFLQAWENNPKSREIIRLAIIVQDFKKKVHLGHLSNERRVARRIQDWVYEFAEGTVGTFAIKSHYTNADQTSTIKAMSRKELTYALRNIATFFDYQQERRHLEWVWDGGHVWLVQGDLDVDVPGTNPDKFLKPDFPIQTDLQFQLMKHWSEANFQKWDKIENQFHFKEAGLPTYPLWVLEDPNTLREVENNNFSIQLTNEIDQLARYPIVVRTDINKKLGGNLDLPRSDTLNSSDEVREFLLMNTRKFLTNYKRNDFCFILHQYIPCKSSAFSLSFKDNPRVSIDSLWGIADGLQYYEHDTFEFDTSMGMVVKDDPGYKQEYLASTIKGKWQFVYSGKPWDWSPSLKFEEIRDISNESVKLSKLLQKNLIIMWFVGIPKSTNIPNVIPWWYKEIQDAPKIISPSDKSVFNRRVVTVSTPSDLQILESLPNHKDLTLKLNPQPDLLREKDFINKIIQLSKDNNFTIDMHGSPLCHAYYQMRNAGVNVSCEDRIYRKSKIFRTKATQPKTFDKLVRDKIPQIIVEHGEQVSTLKVGENDLVKALKEKLIEESYELFWSDNEKNTREELSDIYEVMMTLARMYHISPTMIRNTAEKKRKSKGGFEDGMYLLQTLENPLITTEDQNTLFPMSQLSSKPKPKNIPELKNNKLSISLIPPSVQPIKLKLPESARNVDESTNILIRYEGKRIIIEFLKNPKVEEGSKFIEKET